MTTSSPITCAVLIDGGNFYHKLKTLGITNQLQFDFSGFATFLAQGDALVHKRYYVGAVSNKDKTATSERLHRNQQRLLAALTTHGFNYALGYLLQDGAGVYHEKASMSKLPLTWSALPMKPAANASFSSPPTPI
jgi:hypothetical protein